MIDIPPPSECVGVIGLAIAAIGLVASVVLLIFFEGVSEAWYLLAVSGLLWMVSWLSCWGWEWDHLPLS